MREASPMTGEENLGITLTRTFIPTLPAHYLSRKHLFPLIENEAPGTTIVIAPAGYGKSSLVSEWAQSRAKSVIWMTVSNEDSLAEMSAMLIVATRNVIPGFAPWFESDQPLRPTEVVRRWGNELLQTGKEYVFVIDNLRSAEVEDVDIANKLIDQFPSNVHFVAIRKTAIESIYATCASRGPLKVVTLNDLRFSDGEIEILAANSGVALDEKSATMVKAASGWPSATSLLIENLKLRGEAIDIEKLIASDVEPLRALALIVANGLDEQVRIICERLSILESFTLEIAQVLLGNDFCLDTINEIAAKGEIFTVSRDPHSGFIFSPIMRQVFLESLRNKKELKIELHKALVGYFENAGLPAAALEHALQAGDGAKIREHFQMASRFKQAQGQGADLIRWSQYIGDSSFEGELKRSTVIIAGLLSNLDFTAARSEISRLQLQSTKSEGARFYEQFAAGASAYIDITLGNFQDIERNIELSAVGSSESLLGIDDQISLIRLLIAKRYIWNEGEKVEALLPIAEKLAKESTLLTSHTFLLSIQAMVLHERGEYRRAFDAATMSITAHQKHGFVGSQGPIDAMYVKARCLLEFSRRNEAMAIFEQIQSLGSQWRQWHWYFASENHIIQEMTLRNQRREALERLSQSRSTISTIDAINHLSDFCDINEMYIRRKMGDYDRLENLVNRAPRIRYTSQFKMAVDEYRGRKNLVTDAEKLPANTPRDQIWKFLLEASLNIGAENIALPAMQKAMKIGSDVGAKETFLRQRDEIGNLIIRIANDSPTIYNEDLATAMAARMKERGDQMENKAQALTKRELEILRQLSTGRTLTVIAGELHISQNTMKTHLKNLYKKIGAEGRHDAVEKAKAQFLI
jgi:LuxR family transcriptional regulator, maltose regulon positive regulatory protein